MASPCCMLYQHHICPGPSQGLGPVISNPRKRGDTQEMNHPFLQIAEASDFKQRQISFSISYILGPVSICQILICQVDFRYSISWNGGTPKWILPDFPFISSFKTNCHELPWRLPLIALDTLPCHVDLRNFLLWSRLQAPQPTLHHPGLWDFPPPSDPALTRHSKRLSSTHMHGLTCIILAWSMSQILKIIRSLTSVSATKLGISQYVLCWPTTAFWAWQWGSCSRSWYLQPQRVVFEKWRVASIFQLLQVIFGGVQPRPKLRPSPSMYLSTCFYKSLVGLSHNVQYSLQPKPSNSKGWIGWWFDICPDRLYELNYHHKNVLPGYARMLNLCSTAVQSNQTTSPLTPTPRLPQNFTTCGTYVP